MITMSQNNTTTDAPTATEFIPAAEVTGPNRTGKPIVRIAQLSEDGHGIEVVAHEPYNDDVPEHTAICDQCGFEAENADMGVMADHLADEHTDD